MKWPLNQMKQPFENSVEISTKKQHTYAIILPKSKLCLTFLRIPYAKFIPVE